MTKATDQVKEILNMKYRQNADTKESSENVKGTRNGNIEKVSGMEYITLGRGVDNPKCEQL